MRTLSTAAYQLGAFVVISIFYIASADTAKTAFPGSISTARFPVITPSCTSNTPKVSKLIRPREDPLVAFTDIAGWSILHICAQYCLNNPYEDNIWTFADCQPNESECACLPDSQPIVVRSLSSCLSKTCTSNTADFARATSVYALFCSSVSGAPATTEFPTASGNNIVSVPITIVSTTTLLTSTSSSLSSLVDYSLSSSLVTSGPPSLLVPSSSTSTSATSTASSSVLTLSSAAPLDQNKTDGSQNQGGSNRQDILVIVFGVIGSLVAIGVAVWQGRNKESICRKCFRRRGPVRPPSPLSLPPLNDR